MKETTRYTIVMSSKMLELEKLVEAKLRDGWYLQGGIAITNLTATVNNYYQAMVKDENSEV